jgi:hypothetical protein
LNLGGEVAEQVAELAKAQKVLCDHLEQDVVAAHEAYVDRVHEVRETLRNLTFAVLHLMPEEKLANVATHDYMGALPMSGLFVDAGDPVGVTCASVQHCASLGELGVPSVPSVPSAPGMPVAEQQQEQKAGQMYTPFEQVPESLKARGWPDLQLAPPPPSSINSSDA